MTNDRLTDLEHRLALSERELAKTLVQIRALEEHARPRSRLRRTGMVGILGLGLAFAATRGLVTEAQGPSPEVLTVKAPFKVMDASGKKIILRVAEFDSGISLTIGDVASGGVTIGVGPTGSGVVNVRTAAGKFGVALRDHKGEGMGVHVFGPDGETVEGSLALGPTNQGRLSVGAVDSGGMDAGVGKSGAGFMNVRLLNAEVGVGVSQRDGRPMGVGVFGANGSELVSMRTTTDQKGAAVRVYSDAGKELVGLTTDQKGGSVQVMNPDGVGVAGLLATDGGGRVALTGPSGGKSAVSLSVEPTGGKVRVFPRGGGSAQAELTSEAAGGAFTAYNSSGSPIAFFGSKQTRGYLELNDAGGKVMIEAGSLPEHKGYVLASPYETRGGVLGDPSVLKGGKAKQ
jgi:hypothetical protein